MNIDRADAVEQARGRIAEYLARPGVLFLAFLSLTLISLAAMRFWTMPVIEAAAGGLPMFDLRMEGYGAGEARFYLAALTPEGRAAYLGPQRVLDTVLPMALTGTLALAGYLLTRRWSRFLGVALAAVPLVYFSFDMLENAQVAAMLHAVGVSDAMAEAASRWTVLKGQALRFSLAVVLVPLAGRALDLALGGKDRT